MKDHHLLNGLEDEIKAVSLKAMRHSGNQNPLRVIK